MNDAIADRMQPRGTAPTEFLKSHRAITACAREIEALADAIVTAVDAWHSNGLPEKPTARRSPGRCVVQVGAVALSFAWLPATHKDIAAGELLMIVWHGIVGPRRDHQFERVARAPIPHTATEVWEQVFHPGVVGAESWRWCESEGTPQEGFTATALASLGVERLQAAYDTYCAPLVQEAVPTTEVQ